jgi:hypothetical protein
MTRREFSLSLLAAVGAVAADTPADRGKQLIDKTIHGLGGDAFLNMSTRTEIGRAYSFYHERLSGLSIARIYSRYVPLVETKTGESPLGEVQRQVLGKKQEDTVLFTTEGAYEVTYRGARPLPDDQVSRFRDTTLHDIFYILHERLHETGIIFEHKGIDVVDYQPVETLEVTDSENRTVTVWINSDTGLPVKQKFRRWDPVIKDWREEVTYFTRYRDAGGRVLWPYSIERDRDGEKIYVMYSEKVTVNDPLEDDLFRLPGGIKILKK